MKRTKLLSYLEEHGCVLYREGAKHSVFVNISSRRTSAVPRHREIKDILAHEICKDLGLPKMTKDKQPQYQKTRTEILCEK